MEVEIHWRTEGNNEELDRKLPERKRNKKSD